MTPVTRGARQIMTTGWIPFALVVLAFVAMVHRAADVEIGDVTLFLGYLAGWIVLPGTVIWRAVDPRRERRHLAEDLAIGALVGYVVEFPVYLAFLAVGAPHAYLVWPVLVLAFVALTPWGRRVVHPGTGRLPLAWSWSAAAVSVYVIVWFGHYLWGQSPVSTASLSRPYVDEPFHLSLATGLKHFFPPKVTYVADTPLDYHWLSHLHIAASSWVTGVEPIVLLRGLAIPALSLIVLFAAAMIAVRLTGVRWVGPVLLAGIAVCPADFSAWGDGIGEAWLSTRLVVSPSAGFVNAALLLGLLLCIELLTRTGRAWGALALASLAFVAMAGAKSTSLPTVMAGLIAATVVTSLVQRALNRRAALLAVCSVVAFEVARVIFFGSGSHGLALDPLGYSAGRARRFPGLADAAGDVHMDVRLVIALSMVAYLTLGVGALALLWGDGWRRPDHVFLVVTCAAGIGAGLAFHQSSLSEYYFIYVVALPMLLAATLGLRHVVAGMPRRETLTLALISLALAALTALVYGWVTQAVPATAVTGSPMAQAVRLFAVPALVTVAIVVALIAAIVVGHRLVTHGPTGPGVLMMVAVIVCAGMGTGSFLRGLPDIVRDPILAPASLESQPQIAPGGIRAARWLRSHAGTDDVVATNAHCALPRQATCVPRNFWMAGYAERQMLVEGWSYVSRWSIGQHPPADENVTVGPFWDPHRLQVNDAAFADPSPATLGALRHQYDVRWLFVDRRYPADVAGLKEQADVEFRSRAYLVLKLR